MNEWQVVGVIVVLVGLFFTIGKPIIDLNKNITLLNANVQQNNKELAEQKDELKEQRKSARESHQKLWAKNEEQDKVLRNHETRLSILEENQE